MRTLAAQRSHELSNKLSRGEVSDFVEAMTTVINGMQYEHNDAVAHNAGLGPDEQYYKWDTAALDAYGEAAREAMKLYFDAVEGIKAKVAEQLRELATTRKTPEFDQISDALVSGDYSGLAW